MISRTDYPSIDVEESRQLLFSYVKRGNLRMHCIAVAAIMRALAGKMGGDPDTWETIGMLHDIDFELVGGDIQRHGEEGGRILLDHGLGETIAGAVRSHNDLLYGRSETAVDAALQAADNISGLIIAAAAIKGGSLTLVSEKTLRKKFREKAFAAGCRREKVEEIAPFMELPEFFSVALSAMKERKEELGLD